LATAVIERKSVGVVVPRPPFALPEPHAFVVLGCQPLWTGGQLEGALGRRVRAAYAGFAACPSTLVVSGGRTWDGVVEADAMHAELVRCGVDATWLIRERCSLTTRDNARLSAVLLRRLGVRRVTIVTCEWHVRRASAFFTRADRELTVRALPVPSPKVPPWTRWQRGAREWVATELGARSGL
jgi:uncharacterized SAM-binding protein YcdF (DUF218 family)